MSRLWVLGAPDPEMERIEAVPRTMGEDVVHAMRDGRRVHAGNAYRADPPTAKSEVIAVECGWDGEPRVARSSVRAIRGGRTPSRDVRGTVPVRGHGLA
jgi:hypothetical protein